VSAALLAALAVATPFALRDGDRVVFYGDSITEAGSFARVVYPAWVEAYTVTRFPDRDVRFWNRGWAGDTSWGGPGGSSEQRVKRDLGPLRPTVVSIMLGMNDAGYVAYDPKIDAVFREWYGKLLGWVRETAPTSRWTLIQTSPYDDLTRDPGQEEPFTASMVRLGYNGVLLRFGRHVRDAADAHRAQFVDFNAPLVRALSAAKGRDAILARRLVPDAIHPADALHLLMATELLESWQATPRVSDVEIDAARGTVDRFENAKVTGLHGLAWTCLESSLPMPIVADDPGTRFVVESERLFDRLSQQRLAVRGLRAGRYELTIDGSEVGAFSSETLAQGVNLGAYPTPMRTQALRVLELTLKRNRADRLRWREVSLGFASEDGPSAALRGLEELERKVARAQREAARPVPHRFVLRRIEE
jgi:lysophospholipase L1-like esterase